MPLIEGNLIGKYRRLLIPFSDLKAEATALARPLRQAAAAVDDAEVTTEFIRTFAEHRSGGRWPRIKGMPGMIPAILEDWRRGRANLRLSSVPVSALEMLRAQADGWRHVTASFEHALSGNPIEGTRDAFEFALHDLGHAYAFFKEDYQPQGQVEFFKALLTDLAALAPYTQTDTKFFTDLEYCMSDMNSHPQHLRQYLRGVIVEMFLRQHDHSEAELASLLGSLTSLAGWAAPASAAALP